jgi:hypothetical protein
MSPNAYVCFGEDRLLHGYPGEEEVEFPAFTWTYDMFEEITGECVTPSMYNFMAGYVSENISKKELYEIQAEEYFPGDIEERAIDAYFCLSVDDRKVLHDQELLNLYAARRKAQEREEAAMLEENRPFDETSPIASDFAKFMQDIITKARKEIERLDREIHEEEQLQVY